MSPARAGKRLTLALVALLLLALLGPPFLNVGRFKGRIVQAMEQSLGRPVAVDQVSLRLLPRPGFDMKNLVVGDDPGFGAEPMLRAAEVTASLRLTSLWRGRLEVARLSLTEPSLNLVRDSGGRWNLEDLLVRAAQTPTAPTARTRPEVRPRFPYIEAEAGRINLKLGPQKTVFTLSDADFSVWLESEDELGLRLRARPVRTDANLADTGELRISGTLGRTASLGQTPIKLSISLEDAQLGQLSTLIYGRDRGWRGSVQVNAALAGPPSDLALSGSLRLEDFRRYDIVGGEGLRLDATCSATYRAPADALSAIECHVPSGDGEVAVRGAVAGLFGARRYDLSIAAREIPMATVAQLARRAKRNLPDDLTAAGSLHAAFTARTLDFDSGPAIAWAGGGSTSGFRLRSAVLVPELALGEMKFAVEQDSDRERYRAATTRSRRVGLAGPRMRSIPQPFRLVWAPLSVALGGTTPATAVATLDLEGYRVEVRGEAAVPRLLQVARAAGVGTAATGAEGWARIQLAVAGGWKGFAVSTLIGTAQLRKVRVQLEGVNSPVEIAAASLALSETEWSVRDLSAALPAARLHLAGSLSRERNCPSSGGSCLISFALQVPELSTDDLNRVLNPRLVESRPWYAMGGPAVSGGSVLRGLHAEGRLTAGRVLVKSLVATQFSARVHLAEGHLVLDDVQGEVLGGRHRGSWRADFTGPEPLYTGKGSLEGASMEQLARLMRDPWATGSFQAEYDAALRGWTAADLTRNAAGSARFSWQNGSLNRALLPATSVPLRVRRCSGQLSVRDSRLTIPEARLESPAGEYTVRGSASFSRQLDLRVARGAARAFAVTGTLAQPQVAPVAIPQTEAALR